ncbi:ATPase AAA [Bacteroidia bacterium]|nr:ATPase AAA [Bacteroidia bacterium]
MEEIKSRLLSLRLPGMAHCWQTLEETRRLGELSLADGIELLLQSETDSRQENRYNRLLKNAGFRYQASIEELNTDPSRGIDKTLVARLSAGAYIKNGEAILITGASGCGKSFLASAFGQRACRQGFTVAYYNMQKLLVRLKLSRLDGSIIKLFDRLAKTDLLIMDDFGLTALQGQQQTDFLEIIEDRHAKRSTIIVSQLPVASWFDVIGEAVIADAILDRIVHTAHRFELKGESLRKKL